jgi:hypothetical protein
MPMLSTLQGFMSGAVANLWLSHSLGFGKVRCLFLPVHCGLADTLDARTWGGLPGRRLRNHGRRTPVPRVCLGIFPEWIRPLLSGSLHCRGLAS